MRTVYLGTSQFAADVLAILADTPHRPALVLTRPDRPRGRGRRVSPPPVAQLAAELGIDIAQPDSINDQEARERIAAARPDAVCVCAFGALIREPLLSEHPMLNVHPSLLPRWRGAAPIERAIIAGDERTGVSIMRLTAGLDSGPVCASASEPIGAEDTYGTLAPRLAAVGAELLVDVLDRGLAAVSFTEQDEASATYAEKIDPAERLLDGHRPADELERVVRALTPHIGAALALGDGERLGVSRAVARAPAVGDPGPAELDLTGSLPVLGCSPGTLALTAVRPAGRREMPGEAYLRGLRG
ncbi:MAG: methionyl-tRNA formyltransferase [Solirubrobacteraceae bacterium]